MPGTSPCLVANQKERHDLRLYQIGPVELKRVHIQIDKITFTIRQILKSQKEIVPYKLSRRIRIFWRIQNELMGLFPLPMHVVCIDYVSILLQNRDSFCLFFALWRDMSESNCSKWLSEPLPIRQDLYPN